MLKLFKVQSLGRTEQKRGQREKRTQRSRDFRMGTGTKGTGRLWGDTDTGAGESLA